MSIEYRVIVAQLYEQVKCQLKMKNGFSKYFLRNVGFNQGYPLSPTLFGLCIDKQEEIVNDVAKEEGVDGPKLMQEYLFIYFKDILSLV